MGLISRVSSRTYRNQKSQTKKPKMGRRGPKKHLKTLAAPHHWMLPKTGGVFSFRPNAGPHKLRECLPLAIFIRNRLHYALTGNECQKIMQGRMIKVDGKVRTDMKYPAGFMDVISIEKTNENFRLIYDTKGRFIVHRITAEEASYKLCRVKKVFVEKNNVPFLVTHDGRSIRYPNPDCKSVTPSNSTWPPTKSPTGSNSTLVTCAKSSAVRTSVESVLFSPESDTQVPSISSTSRTPPDTFLPLEPATSSCSEKATKLWSVSQKTKVSEKPSPKNEMPEFNND